MMTARHKHNSELEKWLERDLSAEAKAGKLPPAFHLDDTLELMFEAAATGRHPVLVGESGVGKTAAIYELARRAHAGAGPRVFQQKRILQLSIRRCATTLDKPGKLGASVQKLLEELLYSPDPIIPFFCDLDFAFDFNLEPMLQAMAYRLPAPLLAEGRPAAINAMFEGAPELERQFVVLRCSEPDVPTSERILRDWAEHLRQTRGQRISPEAIREALDLSHRFLSHTRLPGKALSLLSQTADLTRGPHPVNSADVIGRFCKCHKVPRFLIDPAVVVNFQRVAADFRSSVLGQPQAVRAVVDRITLIKAGLSDMRRPLAAFLFAGPTGVGKTHLAQILAGYLFGRRDCLVRFNMADYQLPASALTVFGDPDRYEIPQRRGQLTLRLQGRPFAVLLLDEFEKTEPEVLDRFLQLLDEGSFINGAGETVSCRSAIIIATTNAGAEHDSHNAVGFAKPAGRQSADADLACRLKQKFRPELLNRFDEIVRFSSLGVEHIREVARRELSQINLRAGLLRRRIVLHFNDDVLDWLTGAGYDGEFGARYLQRTIERYVTPVIANCLIDATSVYAGCIHVTVRDGEHVVARFEPAESSCGRFAVADQPTTEPADREIRSRGPVPAGADLPTPAL